VNFRNLQVLQEEDFEQQLERNQGKYSLTILILYSLPLVTHLHALIGLPIPYIPIGFDLWLVDLLGPTSLSILYDLEFGLCLCESVWSPIRRDVI
jgi:hypothetical protein